MSPNTNEKKNRENSCTRRLHGNPLPSKLIQQSIKMALSSWNRFQKVSFIEINPILMKLQFTKNEIVS
jgi:hypothetical protein